MSWSRQLETASYRGVEFQCQTLDDEYTRRVARHSYPYRDGADFEDLGREPRITQVRAVIIGDEYEADLGKLLQVIDAGVAGTFVHPILGTWQARVFRGGVHHGDGQRDVAMVDLEVVEDGTNTTIPDLFTIAAYEKEVEDGADEIDALNTDSVEEVTDATAELRTFARDARAAVHQLEAKLDAVRHRIDKANKVVREIGDVESWPLVGAMKRAAYSSTKLAKGLRSLSPPLIKHKVEATCSLVLLAHSLYGDMSRADEIRSMNRIVNPLMIPTGTVLQVYAR